MQIDLLNEAMLGHWETGTGVMQCELQFGGRLVYVQHPDNEPPQRRLAIAQQGVQAAWDDIPQALAFAEQLCEPGIRQVWQLYKQGSVSCPPLEVYSIHFEIDSPYPSYSISQTPQFDWNTRVIVEDELGDEHSIHLLQFEPQKNFWLSVRRLGAGQFQG
ncbi:hypothetical protein NJH83_21320 [Pseudomonas chlororaphis]|uniref:hypothetical protein n=1 Tax=Pseudomonas chlororaphis TaxID=587753 RepID=UPI00209B5294|nr:hypothetical protein [Pseudomonas chlororaphis]MCO7612777.1 hypothetical protein [Pseudomonas chlororaphis]